MFEFDVESEHLVLSTGSEMKVFKRETTETFLYEIEEAEDFRQMGIGKVLIDKLKQICFEKDLSKCLSELKKTIFRHRDFTPLQAENPVTVRFGLVTNSGKILKI